MAWHFGPTNFKAPPSSSRSTCTPWAPPSPLQEKQHSSTSSSRAAGRSTSLQAPGHALHSHP
eukprot:15155330-Heterocapsa_arctica.AAC.1